MVLQCSKPISVIIKQGEVCGTNFINTNARWGG